MLLQVSAFVLLVTGAYLDAPFPCGIRSPGRGVQCPLSVLLLRRPEAADTVGMSRSLLPTNFAIAYREGTFLSNGIGQDLLVVLPRLARARRSSLSQDGEIAVRHRRGPHGT